MATGTIPNPPTREEFNALNSSKASFTNIINDATNVVNVTIPSVARGVFMIVSGSTLTVLNTDGASKISTVTTFGSNQSEKIDDHTVKVWVGQYYRSVSLVQLI